MPSERIRRSFFNKKEIPEPTLYEKLKRFEQYGIKLVKRDGCHYINILGVELARAKIDNGPLVVPLERFNHMDFTPTIMWMLQSAAVAIKLGRPVVIEGGTDIGKTHIFEFICALCGYELHKVPMTQGIEVEDLMGHKDSNPDKRGPNDPDFVFVDRPVTMCLRREEGKIKFLLIDELNAGNDNVLIRLHSVFDGVATGGNFELLENGGEIIFVDNEYTKIGATMNPPEVKYHGIESIQGATSRRLVYLKAPGDLDRREVRQITYDGFGLKKKADSRTSDLIRPTLPIQSQDHPLTVEQVSTIPYLDLLLEKFLEFHHFARELLAERKIGADQPQEIAFEHRTMIQNIRNFIRNFYDGDINEIFQNALRFYYKNRFESKVDRDKLEEQIRLVYHKPTSQPSKRVSLYGKAPIESKKPPIIPQKSSTLVTPRADKPKQPVITPEEEVMSKFVFELEYMNDALALEAGDLLEQLEDCGYDASFTIRAEEMKLEINTIMSSGLNNPDKKGKLSRSQKITLEKADKKARKALEILEKYIKSLQSIKGGFKF